jgi:hypothetical protein
MTRAERIQSRARIRSRGEVPKGEQNVFREDLGFSLTDAQYEAYKKDEAGFQGKYKEVKGELDTASKKVGDIDTDKEFEKAQKKFTKLNVMSPTGEVEATYLMPKAVVDYYNTDVFNKGVGYYKGSYGEEDSNKDEYFVGSEVNLKDDFYSEAQMGDVTDFDKPSPKELHDALTSATQEVRDEFYSTYGPKLEAEKTRALATLGSEKELLGSAKSQRDLMKSDIKKDYESKATARGSALAGAL